MASASRDRIDAERELRELVESFAPMEEAPTDSDLDIASLRPYFHVKVIECREGVDFARPFDLPMHGTPILLKRSDTHNAVVCITKDIVANRWSREESLSDVSHELAVLYFDESTSLLFICSTQRDVAFYDAAVDNFVVGENRRLAPEEVNRVLRGLTNASFFSVGMRNRAGFVNPESYRIITGRAADQKLQKADGLFYDRGHVFGKGLEAGASVTIGFSSSSKIWANRRGPLSELFAWCRALASKLVVDGAVETKSGIDFLPLGKRATSFPANIVAGDWHESFYTWDSLRLRVAGQSGEGDVAIDRPLCVSSATTEQVDFQIDVGGVTSRLTYRLDRRPWFEYAPGSPELDYVDVASGHHANLLVLFRECPPVFFSAALDRVEGDSISASNPSPDPFDSSRIECVDWTALSVDPKKEKPGDGGQQSLFEWLQTRLLATNSAVIFNDDGSGELADYICITETAPDRPRIDLYHCKAGPNEGPIPGDRVEDLYDVLGQAVKCTRLLRTDLLRSHLLRRSSPLRLIRGTDLQIETILSERTIPTFAVHVVQPGVADTPRQPSAHLLASANAYCVSAQSEPLRVIGTRR